MTQRRSIRERLFALPDARKRNLGILLILTGFLAYSLMQVAVKKTAATIGSIQQVFFRNIITLIIAFVVLKIQGETLRIEKPNNRYAWLRGLIGFANMALFFQASKSAPQGDLTVLTSTAPFWTTLISVIVFKEKLSKVQIPVLISCFLGACIILQPSMSGNILPLVMALINGVGEGVIQALLGFFKGKVNPMKIILYFSALSVVISGVWMAFTGFVIPTPYELLLLVLIGVAAGVGQICVTFAFQLGSPQELSIYSYSNIIMIIPISYFMLGEAVQIHTVLGGLLVILSALFSYIYNTRQAKRSAL